MPPWWNAYTLVLETSSARSEGSSPSGGTKNCRDGGIGRRAGFKTPYRKMCGFDSHFRYMKTKPDKCEICGSSEDYLNFHHLIPRTLHSNKLLCKKYEKKFMKSHGIWICKSPCHKQIHKLISEKEMGLHYNTLELLLNHHDVIRFVNWRKKRVN